MPSVVLSLIPSSSCPTEGFSASWRACISYVEICVVWIYSEISHFYPFALFAHEKAEIERGDRNNPQWHQPETIPS